MKTRKLGQDLTVSAIGLGCMGMSFAYGAADEQESIRTLHRAVDLGVTFFDTAEVYGPYENEILLGKALKDVRDRVTIATKFGFRIAAGKSSSETITGVDGRPENARAVAEASLKRLGTDVIDLYYQHRVDRQVPIEETVGAMADLVKAGKVRHLGLSEASRETVRRAAKVHPIAALQSEYSLWSREVEQDALPACRQLGIGFVAYSPLGRGFLTGAIKSADALAPDDWRRQNPRFQGDNLAVNLALVEAVTALAEERGCTPAQLALAWLLTRGPDIVPIPGTRQIERLEENAGAVAITLTADEERRIAEVLAARPVAGTRYPAGAMGSLNV